jgi:hypothetical protein
MLVVVMFGLAAFTVYVPLSLPMRDMASIGEEIFEPLTTITAMSRGIDSERFIVIV